MIMIMIIQGLAANYITGTLAQDSKVSSQIPLNELQVMQVCAISFPGGPELIDGLPKLKNCIELFYIFLFLSSSSLCLSLPGPTSLSGEQGTMVITPGFSCYEAR